MVEHKITEVKSLIYPFLEGVIDRYQKNYKGADKMSREFMMNEIKRFKGATSGK